MAKEMPKRPKLSRLNSDLRPMEDNLSKIDHMSSFFGLDDRKLWIDTIRDEKNSPLVRSGSSSDLQSPLIPGTAEERGKDMILEFLDQMISNLSSLSVLQSDYERSQVIQQLMFTCFKNANNKKVLLNLAKQTSNRLTYELMQVVKTSKDAHKTTRKEASEFVSQNNLPAISIDHLSMSLIDDQLESLQVDVYQQVHSASNI